MKKTCFFFLIPAFLAMFACIQVPVSGVEVAKVSLPSVALENRKDITFSLPQHRYSEMPKAAYDARVEMVRKMLEDTKLFGKVEQTTLEKKGRHHFHFMFNNSSTDFGLQMALATLGGSTLILIPTWVSKNEDISMLYMVDGVERDSATSPTTVKDITWLPLVFLQPFFDGNYWEAAQKRSMQYFSAQIVRQHMY